MDMENGMGGCLDRVRRDGIKASEHYGSILSRYLVELFVIAFTGFYLTVNR